MAVNRGKDFENVIRECFKKVPNTNVERMADPVQGYLGIRNHCDFIVYHKPHEYHIECKSVHGNTFPFSNMSKNQWDGLLEVSEIKGIIAGVIVWWADKDVTRFIPIQVLTDEKKSGSKSIRYDADLGIGYVNEYNEMCKVVELTGKKKRVFFDYDMEQFFKEVTE